MTAEQRRRAIQWLNHGRTPEFIAARLGKSVDEAEATLQSATRGERKPKEPRPCLKCRNDFVPRHAGLWICDNCKAINAQLAPCAWPSGNGASLAGRRSK